MPDFVFTGLPGDKAIVILGDTSIPCFLSGVVIDISGCTLNLLVDESIVHYNDEVHVNVE